MITTILCDLTIDMARLTLVLEQNGYRVDTLVPGVVRIGRKQEADVSAGNPSDAATT